MCKLSKIQDFSFLENHDKTLCFSGHRPKKFPKGNICGCPITEIIKTILAFLIEDSIKQGYRYFISGLSKGVDLWALEYLIYIIKDTPVKEKLHLIGAEPQAGYIKSMKKTCEEKYIIDNFLKIADVIITVCEKKGVYTFIKRNDYMINNSQCLIAVINDYDSGTGYTVKKASNSNLELKILDISNPLTLLKLVTKYPQLIKVKTSKERHEIFFENAEILNDLNSIIKR